MFDMSKQTELDRIKAQKRRDPILVVREKDLTIVHAWLTGEVTSQQIRRERSWTGSNFKYWAASVLEDGYKRGKVVIKK